MSRPSHGKLQAEDNGCVEICGRAGCGAAGHQIWQCPHRRCKSIVAARSEHRAVPAIAPLPSGQAPRSPSPSPSRPDKHRARSSSSSSSSSPPRYISAAGTELPPVGLEYTYSAGSKSIRSSSSGRDGSTRVRPSTAISVASMAIYLRSVMRRQQDRTCSSALSTAYPMGPRGVRVWKQHAAAGHGPQLKSGRRRERARPGDRHGSKRPASRAFKWRSAKGSRSRGDWRLQR